MMPSLAIKKHTAEIWAKCVIHWKRVAFIVVLLGMSFVALIVGFMDWFYSREYYEEYPISTVEELYEQLPALEQYNAVSSQLTLSVSDPVVMVPGPANYELYGMVELTPAGAALLREQFEWKAVRTSDLSYYTMDHPLEEGKDFIESNEFDRTLDGSPKFWMVSHAYLELDPLGTKLYLKLGK